MVAEQLSRSADELEQIISWVRNGSVSASLASPTTKLLTETALKSQVGDGRKVSNLKF
jgi:hypothetical protein